MDILFITGVGSLSGLAPRYSEAHGQEFAIDAPSKNGG